MASQSPVLVDITHGLALILAAYASSFAFLAAPAAILAGSVYLPIATHTLSPGTDTIVLSNSAFQARPSGVLSQACASPEVTPVAAVAAASAALESAAR